MEMIKRTKTEIINWMKSGLCTYDIITVKTPSGNIIFDGEVK